MNKKLLDKLVSVPGLLNYSKPGEEDIEIRPGVFSPVYLNVKSIWGYPEILKEVTHDLIRLCAGVSHIIGIETGGSPYATLISQKLKLNLILCRKQAKGALEFLAGDINGNGNFVIVDDYIRVMTF